MTTEELREKLLDYYSTAKFSEPSAFVDISKIEQASRENLIVYAAKAGIDLEDIISVSEMCDELEQYYECAGFADFYNRKLKNLSDKEIIKLYAETFKDTD